MPVTVGSLTNVPNPGAPIASAWAQDVTGLAVHRFATRAALDAATWLGGPPPKGTMAITLDTLTVWTYSGSAWVAAGPRGIVAAHSAAGVAFASGTPDQFTKTFPAEAGRAYRVHAWATFWADTGAQNTINWQLLVNSVAIGAYRQTNPVVGLVPTDTVALDMYVTPGVTATACPVKVIGTRVSGTSTIRPQTWTITVYDVGPAIAVA